MTAAADPWLLAWSQGFSWRCDLDDCGEESGFFHTAEQCADGYRLHVRGEHPEWVGIVPLPVNIP